MMVKVSRSRTRALLGAGVVLTLAFSVIGCSSSSSAPAVNNSTESGELIAIKVAVQPDAPHAPVYVGIDQGFFEEQGLKVKTEVLQNAAQMVPSILSDQLDFGAGSIPPLVNAVSNDVPVQGIASLNLIQRSEKDTARLLVSADSDIQGWQGLKGKRVAVNALKGLLQLGAVAAAEKVGVEPGAINFVDVPFPEMNAAIASNRVDAIIVVEPFATQGIEAGLRDLGGPLGEGLGDGAPAAVFLTSVKKVQTNSELIAKFRTALEKATKFANENPDAVAESLLKHTGLPIEEFKAMNFIEHYGTDYNPDAVTQISKMMATLGWVETAPSLDELMAK